MEEAGEKRILAQFKSEEGVLVGNPFDLPVEVTQASLGILCNAVLENVRTGMRSKTALDAFAQCRHINFCGIACSKGSGS